MFLFSELFAKSYNFTLTLEKDVSVYPAPEFSPSNLIKMEIGHIIMIISNSFKQVTLSNKTGNWLFIDAGYYNSGENTTIKGWVPSFYIAEKKDFKKVTKFGEYELEGWVGDYRFDYKFNKDGTVIDTLYKEGIYEATIKCNLYCKDKVLFVEVQYKGDDSFQIFYLNETGDLFLQEMPIKAKRIDVVPLLNTNNLFYSITGDNVNVRADASVDGKILTLLSKGARVKLIKRSDIELYIGDKKGHWAYIETGVIKGWVFDYYLKEEGN
jgi:hypothetical protein